MDKGEYQNKPCYLENHVVREPCKWRTACICLYSKVSGYVDFGSSKKLCRYLINLRFGYNPKNPRKFSKICKKIHKVFFIKFCVSLLFVGPIKTRVSAKVLAPRSRVSQGLVVPQRYPSNPKIP